jgi:4-nitrophenyl phosphatase
VTPVGWLREIRGVVLDLDGVVYRGLQALPGAVGFLRRLERLGIPYVFATNNSAATPEQYAERLGRLGIQVEPGRIVTSAVVAAEFLRTQAGPGTPVFVVGGEGLRRALEEAGFSPSGPADASFVVVGLDVEFTYAKLRDACRAIRRGARFIATNRDPNLPVEGELWPGAGALVAAIETATGVSPVTVGKPERPLFEAALGRLRSAPEQTLMVGDQLATDVLGGRRMGMRTVLVLSGVVAEAAPQGDLRPDLVVRDLGELDALWPEPTDNG